MRNHLAALKSKHNFSNAELNDVIQMMSWDQRARQLLSVPPADRGTAALSVGAAGVPADRLTTATISSALGKSMAEASL